MKVCVVFCTIRTTKAFEEYAKNFRKHDQTPDIIIIDEKGDTRKLIRKAFEKFNVEFYGAHERNKWFYHNDVPPDVVPSRTTDVIGFSLLVAYKKDYDMIVFLDDDTYPISSTDCLGQHWRNLSRANNWRSRVSENNWVNPHPLYFPRGYPYALRRNHKLHVIMQNHKPPVLNMGMWRNVPDLNALDYLYLGALNGKYNYVGLLDSESYVLGSRYMPLSRMNIAFKPKIIPAFYQFTGVKFGVGRYGDVFSGLFLMKISKHLGDCLSYGQPHCIHNKEPRDVFKDIRSELEAIKLNETMWQALDEIMVEGNDYASCYLSLADGLLKYRCMFHIPKYIDYLVERMKAWVETVEA